MDLNQLQYFRTAARSESLTQAARSLHITQPALSKVIARVEEFAGAPLFDRVRGKLQLNDCGRVFLEHTDRIFQELDTGLSRIRELQAGGENVIRLAASFDSILFRLVEDFFVAHPQAKLQYTTKGPNQIREELVNGTLDFALTDAQLEDEQVEWHKLYDEEILLLVNENSPLAGRESVSFRELAGVPLMCESAGGSLRILIDRCFARAGVKPVFVLESSESSAHTNFSVGIRYAACFIPAHRYMHILQAHPQLRLHALRLTDPACIRATGLARNRQRAFTRLTQEMYDFVWAYFESLKAELQALRL